MFAVDVEPPLGVMEPDLLWVPALRAAAGGAMRALLGTRRLRCRHVVRDRRWTDQVEVPRGAFAIGLHLDGVLGDGIGGRRSRIGRLGRPVRVRLHAGVAVLEPVPAAAALLIPVFGLIQLHEFWRCYM